MYLLLIAVFSLSFHPTFGFINKRCDFEEYPDSSGCAPNSGTTCLSLPGHIPMCVCKKGHDLRYADITGKLHYTVAKTVN